MDVNDAGFILHEVVPHADVVEVGRYEDCRVRLLSSQQLRQHRAHEVLEPQVVLGGKGVARYFLEHLTSHQKRKYESLKYTGIIYALRLIMPPDDDTMSLLYPDNATMSFDNITMSSDNVIMLSDTKIASFDDEPYLYVLVF